jgi:hypothetical protein
VLRQVAGCAGQNSYIAKAVCVFVARREKEGMRVRVSRGVQVGAGRMGDRHAGKGLMTWFFVGWQWMPGGQPVGWGQLPQICGWRAWVLSSP